MAPKKPIVAPRRPPSLTSAPTPEQLAEQERRERAFVEGADVSQVSAGRLADVSEVSAERPRQRAPAGTKAVFERLRGAPRRRANLYFPLDVWEALEAHCRREDVELSAFVTEATRRALRAKGGPR